MIEEGVLFIFAFIWIAFAVVSDLKKREIPNWLNFSIVIFVLGFRFFYSLFSGEGFSFFYYGLLGFFVFYLLGNLFYSVRLFAGGDSRLFTSLGVILPIFPGLIMNVKFSMMFLLIFFMVGGAYSLIVSFGIGLSNFEKLRRGLGRQIKEKKKLIMGFTLVSIFFLALGFHFYFFFYFGIFVFVLTYLYIYALSVDESFMVKKVVSKNLTPGDLLYKDVFLKGKKIKSTWDGLSKKDILLLRKNKRDVFIRYGIPFAPVFLISIILFIFSFYLKVPAVLWNSFG